jgi:hypothetical protein
MTTTLDFDDLAGSVLLAAMDQMLSYLRHASKMPVSISEAERLAKVCARAARNAAGRLTPNEQAEVTRLTEIIEYYGTEWAEQ